MKTLLRWIEERGELADSLAAARELSEPHDTVMGIINSMCAAELVVTEPM